MMKDLCDFMGFSHRQCKEDLHKYMQIKMDDDQRIKDLDSQLVQLVHQVNELRAINDYQAFEFQQRIDKLQKEYDLYKEAQSYIGSMGLESKIIQVEADSLEEAVSKIGLNKEL